MELYTVTIRGYKYYFCGNISQSDCVKIDSVCVKFSSGGRSSCTPDELFHKLIRFISSEYEVAISPIQPKYIFRIN